MTMADQPIYLKLNDTLPSPTLVLYNPDGTIYDLTGAGGQWIHILLSNGNEYTKAVTVVDSTAGQVRVDWATTDYSTTGLVASPDPLGRGVNDHRYEVEVVDSASARLSFPNDTYYTLHITDDIADGTP